MSAFRLPRHPEAFSLDRTRKGDVKADPKHLAFIRTLPCAACGSHKMIEAAHVRFGDPGRGKSKTGIGTKPSDAWVTPLCASCHRTGPDAQHNGNEREFWNRIGIDPVGLAMALKAISGDQGAGEAIIAATRHRRARKGLSL